MGTRGAGSLRQRSAGCWEVRVSLGPHALSGRTVYRSVTVHGGPLHFTPTSSSWTNLIERWFKELTDRMLRRGVFTSVPELQAAILNWSPDQFNDDH